MIRTKLAKDLLVGDLVIAEPERGRRARKVLAVMRIVGRFPVEVHYENRGTFHYSIDDTVELEP